jgi:hypothetical protein
MAQLYVAVVKAVQVEMGCCNAPELAVFLRGMKTDSRVDSFLFWPSEFHKVEVRPGTWILKGSDGGFCTVDPENFGKMFRLALSKVR